MDQSARMNIFLKLVLYLNILNSFNVLITGNTQLLNNLPGSARAVAQNHQISLYQRQYLRYTNIYIANYWYNYSNQFKSGCIKNQIIKNFINQQTWHNPAYLPSSYQLFYTQKPPALVWSILIPTLIERSGQFEQIFTKLLLQIVQAGLQDKVEIVFYRDNRDATVGYKRNQLIKQASGQYICFVDDDDDISNNYIELIYNALLQNKDCVKLIGVFSANNLKKLFIHSISYDSYFEANYIYYRPPNHLNPIKREIAINFQFPNQLSFGEDTDWAMQICRSEALKTEAEICEPYYFYNFDAQKSVSLQRRS